MPDWFEQHAAKADAPSGDWFASHAPAAFSTGDNVKAMGKSYVKRLADDALGIGEMLVKGPTTSAVEAATGLATETAKNGPLAALKSLSPIQTGQGTGWEKAGTAGADATMFLLPFLGKGKPSPVRIARTGMAAPELGAEAFKSPVSGFSMPTRIATAAKAIESPAPSVNAGGKIVQAIERPAAQPPVTSVPKAITAALDELKTPAAAPVKAAVPAMPESWQKLVDAAPVKKSAPIAAPAESSLVPRADSAPMGLSSDTPLWSKGEVTGNLAKDMRGALGAEDAGAEMGLSADAVRDLSGAPKRRPLVADLADLDRGYQRMLADPRGAIDPKLLKTVGLAGGGAVAGGAMADDNPVAGALVGALGGAAVANPAATLRGLQTLRMTGMLSGAALPKSMAGNVGAFLTSAAEQGSMKPIAEMLRVPTNLKNAVKGFRGGANPASVQGMGAVNIPGRLMGAFDEASTQGLQRGGETLDGAQRLLLTKPNPVGDGPFGQAVKSPIGRLVMPFQKTPFNGIAEGLQSLNELQPGSGASTARRALTVGTGVGGAVAGSQTDDPMTLAILAALAGPRAIPFALGAGLTAGPEVIKRVGVGVPDVSWKDFYDPLRPINQPALLRLLEQAK